MSSNVPDMTPTQRDRRNREILNKFKNNIQIFEKNPSKLASKSVT